MAYCTSQKVVVKTTSYLLFCNKLLVVLQQATCCFDRHEKYGTLCKTEWCCIFNKHLPVLQQVDVVFSTWVVVFVAGGCCFCDMVMLFLRQGVAVFGSFTKMISISFL